MKYILRALKYFVTITIIMVAILVVLALFNLISSDIDVMFNNGWKSVLQIELMFLCVSFVYPHFGYGKRSAVILGEFSENKPGIIEYMESKKYDLMKDDGEVLVFCLHSKAGRVMRMFEDKITIAPEFGGVSLEGLVKDTSRLVYGLEYKFRNTESE